MKRKKGYDEFTQGKCGGDQINRLSHPNRNMCSRTRDKAAGKRREESV